MQKPFLRFLPTDRFLRSSDGAIRFFSKDLTTASILSARLCVSKAVRVELIVAGKGPIH
jgi:hypothetical protein